MKILTSPGTSAVMAGHDSMGNLVACIVSIHLFICCHGYVLFWQILTGNCTDIWLQDYQPVFPIKYQMTMMMGDYVTSTHLPHESQDNNVTFHILYDAPS